MKIRAKVQSYATREIDVEFPCYVHTWDVFDHGGGYRRYKRYEADGTSVTITAHDTAWIAQHWEFERNTIRNPEQLRQDLGYHLIEHDHRSTAEEFYAALNQMFVALLAVPRTTQEGETK